jgi:Mg-chelatase subunit ChlD
MSRFQWHSDWVGSAGLSDARLTVLAAKRVGKPVFLSVDIAGSLHGTRLMMDAERAILGLLL